MRIVILGAGASRKAGYPLASELLDELDRFATGTPFVQAAKAWKVFLSGLDALPAEIKAIARHHNPEVVLTLLDLIVVAAKQTDNAEIREAEKRINNDSVVGEFAHVSRSQTLSGELVSTVGISIARLRTTLECFFIRAHQRDNRQGRESRDYLRRAFKELQPGDSVLTLNWDTLAERTLAEDDRWQPGDGYGFPVTLQVRDIHGNRTELPDCCKLSTQVRVLKLHGSVGWRLQHGPPYLDSHQLLDGFPFHCAGSPIKLRDARAPDAEVDSTAMAYPSYLKRIPMDTLLPIWVAATDAILRANQVDVWGYSLPEDDAAMRSLLLPLRLRVAAGECRVHIHDPSLDTHRRWVELLGDGVVRHVEQLG